LLRDTGLTLAPLVEGVRQDSLETLEASLLRFGADYGAADRPRRKRLRAVVMEARNHARWAARKPAIRALQEEMVMWMNTWLENPRLCPAWVKLRRTALETVSHP